jgi:hypothetical protein
MSTQLLRFDFVLDTLNDVGQEPRRIDDVVNELESSNCRKEQIYSVLTKMEEKGYISIDDVGLVSKLKELSTFSDSTKEEEND